MEAKEAKAVVVQEEEEAKKAVEAVLVDEPVQVGAGELGQEAR